MALPVRIWMRFIFWRGLYDDRKALQASLESRIKSIQEATHPVDHVDSSLEEWGHIIPSPWWESWTILVDRIILMRLVKAQEARRRGLDKKAKESTEGAPETQSHTSDKGDDNTDGGMDSNLLSSALEEGDTAHVVTSAAPKHKAKEQGERRKKAGAQRETKSAREDLETSKERGLVVESSDVTGRLADTVAFTGHADINRAVDALSTSLSLTIPPPFDYQSEQPSSVHSCNFQTLPQTLSSPFKDPSAAGNVLVGADEESPGKMSLFTLPNLLSRFQPVHLSNLQLLCIADAEAETMATGVDSTGRA